ncbi:dioxygenase [Kingella denitrificans]
MNSELTQSMQTESFGDIQETLHFLLEECSIDEAPSIDEIRQWQQILQQRGGKFARLAEQCRRFAEEYSPDAP